MGQSTDAILCFGIDAGEDGLPWQESTAGENFYFEDWLEAIGVPEKECPIEVVQHCSSEYPMFIIAVRGTCTRAARGFPVKLSNLADRDLHLKPYLAFDWCKRMGISAGELKDWSWLLASDWS